MAEKTENHAQQISLLDFENRFLNGVPQTPNKQIEVSIEESTGCMDSLRNTYDYRILASKMFQLVISRGMARTTEEQADMDKIISRPAFESEEHATTFDAKLDFHNTLALYHFHTGDKVKGFTHLKKIQDLYSLKPEKKEQHPSLYARMTVNFLNGMQELGRSDELLQKLQLLHLEIQENTLPKNVINFLTGRLYLLELLVLSQLGRYETAEQILPASVEWLEKQNNSLPIPMRIVLTNNIANVYFGLSRYEDCLDWLNKVLEYDRHPVLNDVLSAVRLLYLIVHYELGHNTLMESLLKSAYRFLLKRNKLFGVEKKIIQFIRQKLTNVHSEEELMEAFKELHQELTIMAEDPCEREGLENFGIMGWLKSKIEKRPYHEVALELGQVVRNENSN